MTWLNRIAVGLLLCAGSIAAARAAEPADQTKAKIEFRWLEEWTIPEVTENRGIRTTCGDELSYLHRKAILTREDVAAAEMFTYDLRANNLGIVHEVKFRLTDEALRKLEAAMSEKSRFLATLVDGRYWSAALVTKGKVATLVPRAGFFSSQADAQRVVDAFK